MEETNIDNTESTNGEEVVVTDTTEDTSSDVELVLEDDTTEEVDVAKLQEINKKLFARAKKAEELLKANKPQVKAQPKEQITKTNDVLTREEAILIAQGYDEVALAKIKAVSKGNGCSLLDATKDEMFVLWKDKQDAETKKAKSSIGASRGSGSARAEKSISEMTEEEHRALIDKTFNN